MGVDLRDLIMGCWLPERSEQGHGKGRMSLMRCWTVHRRWRYRGNPLITCWVSVPAADVFRTKRVILKNDDTLEVVFTFWYFSSPPATLFFLRMGTAFTD